MINKPKLPILIVEDERHIADLHKLYLTKAGFGVHIETTGEGALKAARTLHPSATSAQNGTTKYA